MITDARRMLEPVHDTDDWERCARTRWETGGATCPVLDAIWRVIDEEKIVYDDKADAWLTSISGHFCTGCPLWRLDVGYKDYWHRKE